MTPEQELQLDKLARTLVKSSLASSYREALKRAREMLKIPEEPQAEAPEPNPGELPTVGEIEEVPISLGIDFEKDKTLKEVLEEDAKTIYGKEPSQKSQ